MTDEPTTEPTKPASCCSCCSELGLDADDLALISISAGILSATFGMFGAAHLLLRLLTLPLGLAAVVTGYTSLKQGTAHRKAGERGIMLGVFGVGLFVVISLLLTLAHVVGWR